MQLKRLLLATTGLCMVSFAPFPALAQDGLADVYKAYVQAQDHGDAEAKAAAEANLRTACESANLGNFDDCITIASGATPDPATDDDDDDGEENPSAMTPQSGDESAPPPAEGQPPAGEQPPAEAPAPAQQ